MTGFSLTDNYSSLFDGTPNVSYIGSGGLVYSTSSNILSASTAILPAGFSGTFSIDGVFYLHAFLVLFIPIQFSQLDTIKILSANQAVLQEYVV